MLDSQDLIKRPLVSIVMPVFNGERFLRASLDSILSQSFTDFELRIADNYSSDATGTICREYAAKDSRIIYHKHSKNIGVFANAEWLYMEARGEFLMLVGDDDVYDSNYLECCVERIVGQSEIILVYSDYYWINVDGDKSISGLNIFMCSNDGVPENLFKYIRAPIVLPLMMGLFRTKVLQQAMPFPNFGKYYRDFLGGRDIALLWTILTKGKVDSIRSPMFSYRDKDRKYVVPTSWGGNPIIIQLRIIHVNLIIMMQYAIPEIMKSPNIIWYKKIFLLVWYFFIFLMQYSLLPIAQKLKRRLRHLFFKY